MINVENLLNSKCIYIVYDNNDLCTKYRTLKYLNLKIQLCTDKRKYF